MRRDIFGDTHTIPGVRLRAPIPWFGGKGKMMAKLLPLLPAHHIYVEPYGGAASLLFAKEPSPVEVYNDLDGDLVAFFNVLADPELFVDFYRRVALLPYSRGLFNEARARFRAREWEDEIERAVLFFVIARQSFSGIWGTAWGFTISSSVLGRAQKTSGWQGALRRLPLIHARLQRVQIECKPGIAVIEQYDRPETFFYVDPPYPPGTRRSGKLRVEMNDADHRALVEALLSLKGKALLSGYPTPLYDPLVEAGWALKQWETACHAAGKTRGSGLQGAGAALKKQGRTECAWMNYRLRDEKGLFS